MSNFGGILNWMFWDSTLLTQKQTLTFYIKQVKDLQNFFLRNTKGRLARALAAPRMET